MRQFIRPLAYATALALSIACPGWMELIGLPAVIDAGTGWLELLTPLALAVATFISTMKLFPTVPAA